MPIVIYEIGARQPMQAIMMVVDILGLEVETRNAHIPTEGRNNPEYLKKKPFNLVPILEDDGLVLSGSHVIIMYLTSKYGGSQQTLYPNDVTTRAVVDQRLFFDATILWPILESIIDTVVKKHIAPKPSDEQVADIVECYDVTEKYLEREYIAGNILTLADVSCVVTLASLDCIIPIDKKYVKLHDWWARLKTERWYQKRIELRLKLFRRLVAKKILTAKNH